MRHESIRYCLEKNLSRTSRLENHRSSVCRTYTSKHLAKSSCDIRIQNQEACKRGKHFTSQRKSVVLYESCICSSQCQSSIQATFNVLLLMSEIMQVISMQAHQRFTASTRQRQQLQYRHQRQILQHWQQRRLPKQWLQYQIRILRLERQQLPGHRRQEKW